MRFLASRPHLRCRECWLSAKTGALLMRCAGGAGSWRSGETLGCCEGHLETAPRRPSSGCSRLASHQGLPGRSLNRGGLRPGHSSRWWGVGGWAPRPPSVTMATLPGWRWPRCPSGPLRADLLCKLASGGRWSEGGALWSIRSYFKIDRGIGCEPILFIRSGMPPVRRLLGVSPSSVRSEQEE